MKVARLRPSLLRVLPLISLLCLLYLSPSVSSAAQDATKAEQGATQAAQDAKERETKYQSRWERLRAGIIVKEAEYAGTEVCGQSKCHADTVKTWTQLPHSRNILNAKDWSEDERSCEGCHGPGSEHATDREHGFIAKLSEHPEYVAALCTRCHHRDIAAPLRANHFLATVHANAKISCGTCHDVHRDHQSVSLLRGWAGAQMFGPKKKKTKEQPKEPPKPNGASSPSAAEPPEPPKSWIDRGVYTGFSGAALAEFVSPQLASDRQKITALCSSCHPKQRGELHQNSRHPVADGRMSCVDCHHPHRSEELSHFSQRTDEKCVTCHSDKRGPFVYAHDMTGVGDGCQSCHVPHGSPNNKLMKLNGRALCLQCHSDINLDSNHQFRPGNCWAAGCHADFHGSQTSRVFIATGARALRSRVLGSSVRQESLPPIGRGLMMMNRATDFSDLVAWLAAAPGEEPAKSDAKESVAKYEVEAVGSYQNLGTEGNLSKYHQYNVKPDGLFSNALGLRLFDKTGAQYGSARWTGLDEPGQMFALRLDRLSPSLATLRYDYDRASFFVEPSLAPRDTSKRTNQTLLLSVLPKNKPPEIDLLVQRQRIQAPGLSRLFTGGMPGSLDYRATAIGPELRFPFAKGDVAAHYLHRTFDDFTGFLPRASINLWQARYDRDIGAKTSAFASASGIFVSQTGLQETRNVLWRAGATTSPMRNLTVSALVSIEDVRNPVTANAFVLDNDSVVLRGRYRLQPRIVLEGGYEQVRIRRVNNTQTFIDTPRWSSGWFAVRAAPAQNVNFLLRQTVRRLHNAPPGAIPNLASTASLFFNDEDRTDAVLTILLPHNALLYGNYGRIQRDNDDRQVRVRVTTTNFGLALPLSSALSFNVDWNRQNWTGQGDVFAAADPLNLNFGRPLVSDGDYVNAALTYVVGKNTWTTNLYRYTSSGGESVRGKGFWIGYERRLKDGLSARLQVGWDDYEDRILSGFDNSDSFIRVDLVRRF